MAAVETKPAMATTMVEKKRLEEDFMLISFKRWLGYSHRMATWTAHRQRPEGGFLPSLPDTLLCSVLRWNELQGREPSR
jgi:hypothetical protein